MPPEFCPPRLSPIPACVVPSLLRRKTLSALAGAPAVSTRTFFCLSRYAASRVQQLLCDLFLGARFPRQGVRDFVGKFTTERPPRRRHCHKRATPAHTGVIVA